MSREKLGITDRFLKRQPDLDPARKEVHISERAA